MTENTALLVRSSRASTIQAVLNEWHVGLLQYDLWPHAIHQCLVNAAARVCPDYSKNERASLRVDVVEALYSVLTPKGKLGDMARRLAFVETWIRDNRDSRTTIVLKFAEAAKHVVEVHR